MQREVDALAVELRRTMPVAAELVPGPTLSQEVLDANVDVEDFLQNPLFAKYQQLLKEAAPPAPPAAEAAAGAPCGAPPE
eukprot:7254310-Pyramimonas_sp.AAC.1